MPLVLADRVKETTTTVGTGTVTLDGAATGYQSFAVIGNGNTTYYTIAGQGTSEWEVGIGTYTSSGTTLSRDTVLASSAGAPNKTSFSAGAKDVFVTYTAARSVNVDGSTIDTFGLGSAAGQILYCSATDTFALLAAGSSSQVLTSGGAGAPSWTSQSSLSVGSATNVAGLVANTFTTYGNTATTTAKNTYYGVLLGNATTHLNCMADTSGNGGFYRESSGIWPIYYNVGNGSVGIMGSTTSSGIALYVNGAVTATGNVTAFSDERYKTNWRSVRQDFVQGLAQVRSGIYDRTDEEVTQVGVSAQSLQKLLPESVACDDNGRLSVAYGNAALVACVELAKEIVKLRAEVDALKKGV